MSDPKEEFMAAAVRPIINHEQRLGLWRWLGELIGKADDASLVGATRRWHEVDARPNKRRLGKLLLAVMLMAAVLGAIPFVNTVEVVRTCVKITSFTQWEAPAPAFGKKLEAKDLLLLGDPAQSSLQQSRALVESDPDNAAFFAEYAVKYSQEHGSLPPDYHEVVGRIDPENAWFDYLAAARTVENAVTQVKRTPGERRSGKPLSWDIKDSARLSQSLEILRLAKGKPRFQNYEQVLLKRRIGLLPQATPFERLTSVAYVAGRPSHQMSLRYLANLIAASGWQAGENGDMAGFREVESAAREVLGNFSKLEDVTVVGELVHLSVIAGISKSLHEAAEKLGLEQDEKLWKEMESSVNRRFEKRKARSYAGRAEEILMEEKGDMLVSIYGPMVARQLEKPVPVTESDLKPGRLMNHRLVAAMSSRAVWVVLGIAATVVFLYRFRGAFAMRLLVARGVDLLGVADWLWIAVGAVLVPCAFVIGVSIFTDLGGSGLSVRTFVDNELLLLPTAHYLSLTLLLMILPILLARWRFSVRARAFGFSGVPWIGWGGVAGLVLFILTYLPAVLLGDRSVYGLLLISVVWMLAAIIRTIFGRSSRQLRSLMVASVIWPTYLLGMVVMVILSPLFLASSQSWFEKDGFSELTPDTPAMMPYEYKVATRLRSEFKEMIRVD